VRVGNGEAIRPRFVRSIFVVLASVSVGLALGMASAVADEAPGGESPPQSPGDEVEAVELPHLRTATSDTFRLSNGERETRLYETPVNYRDVDGDWQPIEAGLEETPSGAIVNGDNSFDVHLPDDLDAAPATVSFGDEWISQQPVGISTSAADLQGEVASYESPASETTFNYSGIADGLKETIELEGPSSPSTYRFELHVSSGVVPQLADDGSIQFRGGGGEVVAEMPAPVMSDAAQVAAPPKAVSYALEEQGAGAWVLSVEADPVWLGATDRGWPVAIDPTLEVKGTALECVILNDGAESPRCSPSQTYLVAKTNYVSSGADAIARSLFRFNLASIPSDAYLTAARIGLYSSSQATNVSRVDMYDVSRSWTNGASWSYWEEHHSPNMKWTTAGGDYGKYMPTPTSVTTAQRGSAPGWWEFSSEDLRWLVQRWKDGTIPNNGVLVKLAEEAPHVCCFERRVQWQGTAEANKPYLSVTYFGPAFADRKVTSPTDGTKTAKRFLLTAGWEQSGVEGVTFQYKSDKGWVNVPEGQVTDESGKAVKWPVKVGNVTDRQSKPVYWDASSLTGTNQTAKVQIRAVMLNISGESGYTKPVEGEVNRDLGGPKDAVAEIGPGSLDAGLQFKSGIHPLLQLPRSQ
jgi:hypothetical protein